MSLVPDWLDFNFYTIEFLLGEGVDLEWEDEDEAE